MKPHFPKLAMAQLCGLFGHTRQAYYKSQSYEYKCQAQTHILLEMVQKERKSLPGIGGRKLLDVIGNAVKNEQLLVGRDAFFDLLRDNHLLVRRYRAKKKTTDSRHRFHKYPNLIRDLVPVRPHGALG